jgi:dolichyldiphosphatase
MQALGSSAKYAVSAGAAFWCLAIRRLDPPGLLAFAGTVTSVVVGDALKVLLQQSRPDSALKADPGMPSTHSAAYGFLFAYIGCLLLPASTSAALRLTTVASMQALGVTLAIGRVAAGYHTLAQAAAGYVLGSVVAVGILRILSGPPLPYAGVIAADVIASIAFILSRLVDKTTQ